MFFPTSVSNVEPVQARSAVHVQAIMVILVFCSQQSVPFVSDSESVLDVVSYFGVVPHLLRSKELFTVYQHVRGGKQS